MLVLLPPSETKAVGGDGGQLDLDALSFPELTSTRRELVNALRALADDVPASLAALGLTERQTSEVDRNRELLTAPTGPALLRYTGVLYDALGAADFTRAEWARAEQRLATASALFGIIRAGDAIPAYRLSAGSRLPGIGPLRAVWRPVLEPALAGLDELIVDLRSGAYASLARVPGAVTVRVVTINATGQRTTVSHHNKAFKGQLAAALARATREPASVDDVLNTASAAGLKVERTGEQSLELLTD